MRRTKRMGGNAQGRSSKMRKSGPGPKKNQKALDSISKAEKKFPWSTLTTEQKKERVRAKVKANPEAYQKRDSASTAQHNNAGSILNKRVAAYEKQKRKSRIINKRGHGGPKSSW